MSVEADASATTASGASPVDGDTMRAAAGGASGVGVGVGEGVGGDGMTITDREAADRRPAVSLTITVMV